MSLHMITHAVMCAVIATLIKKYFQLMFQLEDVKDECFYIKLNQSRTESSVKDNGIPENIFKTFGTCQLTTSGKQTCHFHNLCYHPLEDSFVYFKSEEDDFVTEVKDQRLFLSSPIDFEGHDIQFIFLETNHSSHFNIRWISKPSYIFTRFKPDNLMHVIHDDILPLHSTLKHFETIKSTLTLVKDKFDVNLVLLDDWEHNNYDHLYELFTISRPIYKEEFQNNKHDQDLVCFSSAVVGLLSDTLWYNYGFIKPQNPIDSIDIFNGQKVVTTSQFIKKFLQLKGDNPIDSEYVVLLSRQHNRKIMNENELVLKISLQFRLKVLVLDGESQKLEDMISIVSHSKGMIGIHGSLLILAMFLKPGSFVIEMFPYAIPAYNYTPFKTLTGMQDLKLIYSSWENLDKDSTVGHPEYIKEHGGLGHLTPEERSIIMDQKTVPQHLCCEDPSWLYHIYQDTTVNLSAIVELIEKALEKGKSMKFLKDKAVFPSNVNNLQCRILKQVKCSVLVKWDKPWNSQFMKFDTLNYEIILEEKESGRSIKYITDESLLEVSVDSQCSKSYNIWTRAVVNEHVYGSWETVECYFQGT